MGCSSEIIAGCFYLFREKIAEEMVQHDKPGAKQPAANDIAEPMNTGNQSADYHKNNKPNNRKSNTVS